MCRRSAEAMREVGKNMHDKARPDATAQRPEAGEDPAHWKREGQLEGEERRYAKPMQLQVVQTEQERRYKKWRNRTPDEGSLSQFEDSATKQKLLS